MNPDNQPGYTIETVIKAGALIVTGYVAVLIFAAIWPEQAGEAWAVVWRVAVVLIVANVIGIGVYEVSIRRQEKRNRRSVKTVTVTLSADDSGFVAGMERAARRVRDIRDGRGGS